MPALRSITARSLRHVDRVDVDLTPRDGAERTHLVIVGPNGSGKTTLLAAIADELEAAVEGRPHPARLLDLEAAVSELGPDTLERERRMAHLGRPVRLTWSREERSLPDDFAAGLLLTAYVPSPRELAFIAPGPRTAIDTDPKRARARIADRLIALLAARHAEVRIARQSRDEARASLHEAWQLRVQSGLQRVLREPQLRLSFVGGVPHLDFPDGRRSALDELARGHAAAVGLYAELMLRLEAARLRVEPRPGVERPTLDAAGVLVVDAPEADLDPRLQRELLPTLLELMPRLQLVVATHSPLVAMSLPHARILDLHSRETTSSEVLRAEGFEALVARLVGPDLAAARASTRPSARAAAMSRSASSQAPAPAAERPAPSAPPEPAHTMPAPPPEHITDGGHAGRRSPKDTIRELPRMGPPAARLGTSIDAPARVRKAIDKAVAQSSVPPARIPGVLAPLAQRPARDAGGAVSPPSSRNTSSVVQGGAAAPGPRRSAPPPAALPRRSAPPAAASAPQAAAPAPQAAAPAPRAASVRPPMPRVPTVRPPMPRAPSVPPPAAPPPRAPSVRPPAAPSARVPTARPPAPPSASPRETTPESVEAKRLGGRTLDGSGPWGKD